MVPDRRDEVTTPRGRQLRATLRFEHDDGDGCCLARLVLRDQGPPVAVVSELRDNPWLRGIGTDFGRVADAVRAEFGEDVPWDRVVWVQHHGDFSSRDARDAPESFTVTEVTWFNGHFHADADGFHRYRARPFAERYGDLGLDPVPDVLRALGLEYHEW